MTRAAWLTAALFLAGCQCGGPGPGDGGVDAGADAGEFDAGQPTGRCDIDLEPFFANSSGTTSRGLRIGTSAELIAGPNAHGKIGDFRLENSKIRVVVQAEGRAFNPLPWGGTIIDADLANGGAGNDQFGEIGLLTNFGRTLHPDQYELLRDGASGGAAVVAISGNDDANDYLSIRNKLAEALGRVPYADPYVALPLRITNYFVLNPEENRVRMVTAFCSTSPRDETALAVGDLVDPGYVLEFFNPRACTGGFGFGGSCFSLDQMTWFGYQGQGVAYGYSTYKAGSPTVPEGQNATLSVAGITGSIIGANGLLGLGTWVQPTTPTPREGELRIPPRGYAVIARDFWVAPTLGDIGTLVERARAASTGATLGTFSGQVTKSGAPVPNARVIFEGASSRHAFFTNAQGRYDGALPLGTFQVSAWVPGHSPTTKRAVTLGPTAQVVDLTLDVPHRLTVNVREANGGPMPAKVTVLCPNGPCATTQKELGLYFDQPKDPVPDNVALIGWVGASGTETFTLPAGQYLALVSRGPEYSIFPNDYPTNPGQAVDLRTADGTVNAVLARVLDTTGWMSADLHVHAVNSPDSIIDNTLRALTFAGDGIDVIVSTDHDAVTDYAPAISQAGLTPFLASVIGEEVSPMEWGHYNLFPLPFDASNRTNGGALDWAGGDGPTLTVGEIFSRGRALGAKTVQVNHARGSLGGFTALLVDTDTLATHLDPATLRMPVQAGATPNDSKLITSAFDTFEILNPGDDHYDATTTLARAKFNDWFTLLSRGIKVAGTGVSDTHYGQLATGWRTFVELGVDTPAAFSPDTFSARLNAMRAVVTNGPFVQVQAYRVDGSGTRVTTPVAIGGTVPPDARELGVTVTVQVPEYLDVTKVELYLHSTGDDATCPIDPLSPLAATTRVACNGVTNANWPASGIAASQALMLGPGDRHVVTTDTGVTYARLERQVTFRLPAPTADNWLVVFVWGSRSLAPVLYPYPGTGTTNVPFAFTNPIFIDADGNGYDHPPFRGIRSTTRPPPAPGPRPAPQTPTPAQLVDGWQRAFDAH
ncbi:MAG: CehA/McbA family metallohydrolase [Myxococcaceae bacterium]